MFEKYSAQAIQVILNSQQEARNLGHNYVGTELILLSLISQEKGIASKAFRSIDLDDRDVRAEVKRILGRGTGYVAPEIPFTPRAKSLLEGILVQGRYWQHNVIRTEHMLLAIIEDPKNLAHQILLNMGVNIIQLKTEVLRFMGERVTRNLRRIKLLDDSIDDFNNSKENPRYNPKNNFNPSDYPEYNFGPRYNPLNNFSPSDDPEYKFNLNDDQEDYFSPSDDLNNYFSPNDDLNDYFSSNDDCDDQEDDFNLNDDPKYNDLNYFSPNDDLNDYFSSNDDPKSNGLVDFNPNDDQEDDFSLNEDPKSIAQVNFSPRYNPLNNFSPSDDPEPLV